MRFFDVDKIKDIPKDRVVTYARIVVDYRSQKADPNRVSITAGGNLVQYPGELTTRTANLRTTMIILNNFISTRSARYMTGDTHCKLLPRNTNGTQGVLKNWSRVDSPRIYGFVRPS